MNNWGNDNNGGFGGGAQGQFQTSFAGAPSQGQAGALNAQYRTQSMPS